MPPRTPRYSSSDLLGLGLVVLLILGLMIEITKALLPFVIIGGLIYGSWKVWARYQLKQNQKALEQSAKAQWLNEVFFNLVRTQNGRLSVFDFASVASLDASAAKAFLDSKAREYQIDFETTEQGVVLYCFPTSSGQIGTPLSDPNRLYNQPPGIALIQADLARRLGISPSSVSSKKYATDFEQWSRERDPQGVAWRYVEAEKRFYPIRDER